MLIAKVAFDLAVASCFRFRKVKKVSAPASVLPGPAKRARRNEAAAVSAVGVASAASAAKAGGTGGDRDTAAVALAAVVDAIGASSARKLQQFQILALQEFVVRPSPITGQVEGNEMEAIVAP